MEEELRGKGGVMDEQIYTCRRNDRREANRQREWQVGAEVMSCYSQIAVSHSLKIT